MQATTLNEMSQEQFELLAQRSKVAIYHQDGVDYVLDLNHFKHPGPAIGQYVGQNLTHAFNSRDVHDGKNPLFIKSIEVIGVLKEKTTLGMRVRNYYRSNPCGGLLHMVAYAISSVASTLYSWGPAKLDPAELFLATYQKDSSRHVTILGLDNGDWTLWRHFFSKMPLVWKSFGPMMIVKNLDLARVVLGKLKMSLEPDPRCPFIGNGSSTQAIGKIVGCDNIFFPNDPKSHHQLRQVLIQQFQSDSQLETYALIDNAVERFLVELQMNCQDISSAVDDFTTDAIVMALLGPQEDFEEWREVGRILKKELDANLPPKAGYLFSISATANEALEKIRETCQRRDTSEGSLLRKMQISEFSIEQIAQMMQMLLIVGHGNLASSCSTLLYLLAKHPEWQSEIKEELRDGVVDLDEGHAQNFFLESMRLYPPVWLMARKAKEEIEVEWDDQILKVPKGTLFLISQLAFGRDPFYWQNPDHFDPERFRNLQEPLHPFSVGPNHCPGQFLAKRIIERLLGQLLLKGQLELQSKEFLVREPNIKGRVALRFGEAISIKLE